MYLLLGWPFTLADPSDASDKGILTGSIFKEVTSAIVVGVILAIVWLFASNRKSDTRFLQWIGATKRYGDEDVWDFTFNSSVAAASAPWSAQFEHVRVFYPELLVHDV